MILCVREVLSYLNDLNLHFKVMSLLVAAGTSYCPRQLGPLVALSLSKCCIKGVFAETKITVKSFCSPAFKKNLSACREAELSAL